MSLRFYGMDPENPGGTCPAVFRDEKTGDFFFQGYEVTDEETLAWVSAKSPIQPGEVVNRLPGRMIHIILEACRDRELR